MLAMRIEADIAHQNEIVIAASFAECAIENFDGALTVPLIDFVVRADDTLWRLDQPFAGWIITGVGNERANSGFRLLARRPRLDRGRRRPHVIGQALLRPRLNVGILCVHDGSLRSTGARPRRQCRMCHRGGRVNCCLAVQAEASGRRIPISHGFYHAARRTPSRAIGSAPIYSFARPRQSAGVGYSVDHPCLTTFIMPESSTWRATFPVWAGSLRPTRRRRRIQSFVDPRSRWT